jgi:hypothetical protein
MVPTPEGGANANDRSGGGEQGEQLLTGAMMVSPDGKFAVMQRNQTSVLLDIEHMTAKEMPEQVDRLVFEKSGKGFIAVMKSDREVVSYALPNLDELWRTTVDFHSGPTLARLSDDDAHLVFGDTSSLIVLDAADGELRGTLPMDSDPQELSFVPGGDHALVVGVTSWPEHKPSTPVVDVNLVSLHYTPITIPNCTAPISVLPDGSRAFVSPTFCEEGAASTPEEKWTNPDPVSVIDLTSDGPQFLENLPGFGPVSMTEKGNLVVAYLDVKRMDPSMFKDASQVPKKSGKRYHLMTIDPKSLDFQLTPIGDSLPRFVLAKDGASLLVDATVMQLRNDATLTATIDSSGKATVDIDVFGLGGAVLGSFDLASRTFVAIDGEAASLDRFVQMGDANRVFTLKMTADGLGGDLYRIDLGQKYALSMGRSLRDIGLLPDGQTLLLRERLPAVDIMDGATHNWYRRERYSLSLDGLTAEVSLDFQDSVPFLSGTGECKDYHDC